MKVTFIMPSVGRKEGQEDEYVKSWTMEPLAMAVLAALTPSGIEKVFYDDRFDKIPYHQPTDLAAINIETYTARRAYQIASVYRSQGTLVVMGGFHATLMPDEVAEYADAVVIGEAEEVWAKVLQDVQSGSLQKFYQSPSRPNLNKVFPDRSIYQGKKYTNIALIETGRGCKFRCNFCSISSFFKHSYVPRPIEDIVQEIKRLHKKNIFFVDDNIVVDRKQAVELFKALIPLKINWISQVSINVYQDDELLHLLKKSGGLGVLIGFESIDPDNLAKMGKDVNLKAQGYEAAMKQFKKHKICVYGTFLYGYDHDSEQTISKAYDFVLKHKLFYAAFNHLMPFPGTPLYDQLKKEDRLVYDKWWLEDSYRFGDIAFYPKLLTPQELSELCYKYRYKFSKLSSILKRLNIKVHFQNLTAMIAYFLLNFGARKETDRRRGLPMGFPD